MIRTEFNGSYSPYEPVKNVEQKFESGKNSDKQVLQSLLTNNNISTEQFRQNPGSIKHLEMVFYNFKTIRGLENFPNLTSLSLISQDITHINGLDACPQLERLWICDTQIDIIENLHCPRLKWLVLYANQITEISGLENVPCLEKLILSDNQIKKIENLEHLDNLTHLDVSGNQIDHLDSCLMANSNLETLNIAGNKIHSLFDVNELALSLPNLKTLVLSDTAHGDNPISQAPNLQNLIISLFDKLERFDFLAISDALRLKVQALASSKKLHYDAVVKQIHRNIDLLGKYLAPYSLTLYGSPPRSPEEKLVNDLSLFWERKISELILQWETAGSVYLSPMDPLADPKISSIAKSFAYRQDIYCLFQKVCNYGMENFVKSMKKNTVQSTIGVCEWKGSDLYRLLKTQIFPEEEDMVDISDVIENRKNYHACFVFVLRVKLISNEEYHFPIAIADVFKTQMFGSGLKPVLRMLVETPACDHAKNIFDLGDQLLINTEMNTSFAFNGKSSAEFRAFQRTSRRGIGLRTCAGQLSLLGRELDSIIFDQELPYLVTNFDGIMAAQIEGCLSLDLSCLTRFTNVTQLSLNYCNLTDVGCISVLHSIEELSFNGNSIQCIDDFSRLPNLKYLEARNNQISGIDVYPNGFPELISLDLRGNLVFELKFVSRIPHLLVLYIEDNCLESFASLFELKRAENLLSLYLTGNPVCKIDDYRLYVIFQSGASLKRLNGEKILDEEVSLAKSTWTGILTCELLQDRFDEDLSSLNSLDLSSSGVKRLQCFLPGVFQQLTILNLDGNSLVDASAIIHLPLLQRLNVSRNRITKVFPSDLKIEGVWEHLKELHISSNRITKVSDMCLDHFPALVRLQATKNKLNSIDCILPCQNLTHLALDRNKIKSVHPDAFLMTTKLQVITLRENRLRELMPFSNLPNLRELYLTSNVIANVSEIPALDLPSIELISLCGNPISHIRHYRLYLILQFPNITTIDDVFVVSNEREKAKMIEEIRSIQDQAPGGGVYVMETPSKEPESQKVSFLSISLDSVMNSNAKSNRKY